MKSVTNQMNEEKGKVVKFGLDQIGNPTPTGAKVFFRIVLYVSALWAIASPSITELPASTLETINKYLLLANGLINVTIQFWGWDFPTNNKSNFYNKKP
jgi:hypothetical protein